MELRILLCLVLNFLHIHGDHVAIVAPYMSYKDQDYKAFISTSEISDNVTVVLRFRGQHSAVLFREGAAKRQNNAIVFTKDYNKKGDVDAVKKDHGVGFDLSVFVHKEADCKRKRVTIESLGKKYFAFIQMNKPVYKPNDLVQFRVVLLDPETKPYNVNMIEVQIFDAKGYHVLSLRDIRNFRNGVFEDEFSIANEVNLGKWTMNVIVDGKKNEQTKKEFLVEKYTLPLYQVLIEVPKKVFVRDEEFDIRISGKYAFGAYVNGRAELTIRNSKNNQVIKQENIDISGVITKTIYLQRDLKFTEATKTSIDIEVKMTDKSSETKASSLKTVKVDGAKKYEVKVSYPFPYVPGTTFHVFVTATSYNGSVLLNPSEEVKLQATYGNNDVKAIHENIKNGKASFGLNLGKSVKSFDLKVQFLDTIFTDKIKATDKLTTDYNAMSVVLKPNENKKLSVGDHVWLSINSEFELGTVVILLINRLGIVYYGTHECEGEKSCEVNVKITERMMPAVDIHVYNFESYNHDFFKGNMTLNFDKFGKNYVNLRLNSNKLRPGEELSLNIDTPSDSRVSLMAYDQKLTFKRTGNDLDKKEIIDNLIFIRGRDESLNQNEIFDGTNFILKFDLDDLEECSPEDLAEVKKNVPEAYGRSDGALGAHNDGDATPVTLALPPGVDRNFDKIRENFPESWLFISDKTDIRQLVPDSITSWVISAFSMNHNEGFALADRQELIVSKEFFVEFNLPYSIRLGEVLKVDVIVFNMLDPGSSVSADVTFYADERQFQFVRFTNPGVNCELVTLPDDKQGTPITIPAKSGKTISYYIRPLKAGEITLRVHAATKNHLYTDRIKRKLLVENEGVPHHEIKKHDFDFKTANELPFSIDFSSSNVVDQSIDAFSVIMGSMMQSDATYKSNMFEQPRGCGEQTTSRFAKTLYSYVYLKNAEKLDKSATSNVQNLLSAGVQNMVKFGNPSTGAFRLFDGAPDSTWFTAYIVKMLKQGLDADGIPASSSTQSTINSALNYLRRNQNSDGSFKELGYIANPSSETESAESKKVRLTSFITSVFLLNKNTSPGYESVINSALNYIEENCPSADNYAAALAAYALSFGDRSGAAELMMNQLKSSVESNSDGTKYWNLQKGRQTSDYTKVLITAYGVLAYIKAKRESEVELFVKFLMRQRNPMGGYWGSFDTAIAYEALGEVLKGKIIGAPDFSVTYNVPGVSEIVKRINKGNANTPQLVELGKTKKFKGKVSGRGNGFIHLVIEYFKTDNEIIDDFALTVNAKLSKPGEPTDVDVCITFNKEKYENMVIMDVQLASGYVYDERSDLLNKHMINKVEKEKAGTLVRFYFNNPKRSKQCFKVKAQKVFDVKRLKKASIKAYQYDKKEKLSVYFFELGSNKCA